MALRLLRHGQSLQHVAAGCLSIYMLGQTQQNVRHTSHDLSPVWLGHLDSEKCFLGCFSQQSRGIIQSLTSKICS